MANTSELVKTSNRLAMAMMQSADQRNRSYVAAIVTYQRSRPDVNRGYSRHPIANSRVPYQKVSSGTLRTMWNLLANSARLWM